MKVKVTANVDAERAAQIESHILYSETKIKEYLKTGEIGNQLSLDATLALCHAESAWERIVPEYAAFEKKWIKLYAEVHAACAEIHLKAKEFEFKHWMGFCDEDVAELVGLYRQWEHFDWENATEAEAKAVRDMWNPHDFEDPKRGLVKKHWGKYFKRRSRKPLQDYKGEFSSSDADVLERLARLDGDERAAMEHMKVLMGGSAGRALITMQDRYPQKDKRSIYGGAQITLIFDESSPNPRGGVQGMCATKDEALRLLQACIDYLPVLMPDDQVSIG